VGLLPFYLLCSGFLDLGFLGFLSLFCFLRFSSSLFRFSHVLFYIGVC
jgi:hypothetical protein